ncbi:MAG: BtpA/SgcQ family protein [bacterium]
MAIATNEKIKRTFGRADRILIGMIHLPPLLSYAGFPGMEAVTEKALSDLTALESAGFDAVLVENDDDQPHTEFANPAQIACLTAVTAEICRRARVPVGVQMMLNDWQSSFAVARVTGAQFTRLDVFVDHVTCRWCEINPDPAEIVAERDRICPGLLLLTDIQVKYKEMIEPRPLTASAELAVTAGSDGLIVTGPATGVETPLERLQVVRAAYPDFPLFVGAGLTEDNVREQLTVANGAIVGTSIKCDGRVDFESAKKLREKLKKTPG